MARKRLIVGISGASGAIYGIRLLERLRPIDEVETHLVLTRAARRTIQLETDYTARQVIALADVSHAPEDIAAPISSGSFQTMGMIVAPCSMGSMSAIACSITKDLLTRSADVTLKERRPLVLMVRETPLHLGHLRRLSECAQIGAIIAPPIPAFYGAPKTIEDLIDHSLGRVLDLIGIPVDWVNRWPGGGAVRESEGEETTDDAD